LTAIQTHTLGRRVAASFLGAEFVSDTYTIIMQASGTSVCKLM